MKEKLRLVRTLVEKKSARRKEGRFVVEGPRLVEEAAGQIDFVLYAERLPLIPKLEEEGIPLYQVSRKEFQQVSEVETPQWVLAVVKKRSYGLGDILQAASPLIVCAVGIQDPGNLGSIIRTADAVGVSGVVLTKGTVDPYNGKVVRSTMGSLFHLPLVEVDDTAVVVNELKNRGIKVVAADVMGEEDHFNADFVLPTALLVGNEGAGLPAEISDLADQVVRIPMPGHAESLNVGVSTAVVLYEALRQRTYGRTS